MTEMDRVTIRVPEDLLDRLEESVQRDEYPSISHAIRQSVRKTIPEAPDRCDHCERVDVPLRRIQMREDDPQRLCRECFATALKEDRVHPDDPRYEVEA